MTDRIKEIEERLSKAAEIWGPYVANYPFYASVVKPRGSLSKHDDRANYWHVDDAIFVANARNDIEYLLKLVKEYNNV